jgi:CubicO group peptidase (beta-lactamase class C family)
LGGDIDSTVPPDDWVTGLAALPLIDQPGAGFHYGHSTDLRGLLLSRIEGVPLGEIFERRLFAPLGMKDTAFIVPRGKWRRRSLLYGFDDEGRLEKRECVPGGHSVPERPADMQFVSGGPGLWSTLDDYLAFARIFIEGGP